MAESIKIDVAGVLVYAEQRIRELLGKDAATQEHRDWFNRLRASTLKLCETVQCLSMREPVPFEKIYQPTRLLLTGSGDEFVTPSFAEQDASDYQNRAAQSILAAKALERRAITVKKFLELKQDAFIFAGPGWGKTTFLQHIFRLFIQHDSVLPVLIVLRDPNAIENLERLLQVTNMIKQAQRRDRILLLVDGYDEVSVDDRKRVSGALLHFQALGVGTFYLTCREYYDVFQVKAREVRIDHFSGPDKERFVRAFLSATRSRLDPVKVLNDLETRGFSEFLAHPLLLTLACIVRTASAVVQPRSALRLLDRALEVLCYQWDEQKGIVRHRVTPLDGKDRIQVLKHLAHTFKSPFIPNGRAMTIVRTQLDRMDFDGIDPRTVLLETVQFYGILARRDEGWEFVHRTIHDFLGAKQWVESGEFATAKSYDWNARTAYAACLTDDATSVLKQALAADDSLPTITEILTNAPSFDLKQIIHAVIDYFDKPARVVQFEHAQDRTYARLETDFLRLGSTRFLGRLLEECCAQPTTAKRAIAAYCAIELQHRDQRVEHQTYKIALNTYKTDRFAFIVSGLGQVPLSALNPDAPKTPRLLRSRGHGKN
jgi:hypothetical protein